VQRLAHEFYKMQVRCYPRIMTEYAHCLTGIDIHPGARLGKRFFIDHGTGVVVGETTEIGDNVKVYQGVTLGALAPAYRPDAPRAEASPDDRGRRHDLLRCDDPGGETVIGKGSVIGGNVFHHGSVPPLNQVSAGAAEAEVPRPPAQEPARDGGGAGVGFSDLAWQRGSGSCETAQVRGRAIRTRRRCSRQHLHDSPSKRGCG
jgi:serine O-acetyltransferase